MPCNLCGSDSPRPLFEKNGFTIAECAGCGLRYVDPTPDDDVVRSAYGAEYYADPTGQTYRDYFSEASSRVSAFGSRVARIRRLIGGGRLLDVGCAAGFFLVAARPHFEVAGVELSEAAAAFGRDRFQLDIRTGRLEAMDYPERSFDVVTMWDTIEHLQDPRATLAAVYRVLKPGGLLVVSTADAASVTARWHAERWILYAPPWHLFYFSKRTLTRLLEQSGFQVERVSRGGVPFVNKNAPTGVAALVTRALANRYSGRILEALNVGFILTVFARKRQKPEASDSAGAR